MTRHRQVVPYPPLSGRCHGHAVCVRRGRLTWSIGYICPHLIRYIAF